MTTSLWAEVRSGLYSYTIVYPSPPHTHTDPPDDDMEAAVEGAFEGFNQSGGHNPFMGVEPMGERFV